MTSARTTLQRGIALQRGGRLLLAAQAYSEVLKEDRENADAWHLLGTVEITRRNFDAAETLIARALGLAPGRAVYHHNLAYVFSAKSRMDAAEAAYRRAIELDPGYAEAHFNLAHSIKVKAGDPLIPSLESLLGRSGLSREDRCFLGFAAGKVHDDLGDPDRAFAHYLDGNAAKLAQPDDGYSSAFMTAILETCSRDFLAERCGPVGEKDKRLGEKAPAPIFIVGMPRSGTSLVEQILAGHPDVYGAGELPLIDRIAASLGRGDSSGLSYPDSLTAVGARDLRGFAEAYLREAGAGSGKRVTTDKAPLNFRHLGLIAMLFPGARIVHCRRDPLDTCLSCFFQNFAVGQSYSFDLRDLGRFYGDYREMMAAWSERLPVPIFDLVYEDLIANLQTVGPALLSFCGLDWHPDCARFFETRRPVLTASRVQVRQPLYSTSLGRWRRYEKHLGPLIEALGP